MLQTLPKTIYLWFALLLTVVLVGNRLESRSAPANPAQKKAAAALSGPNFERYQEAERLTRTHYALSGLGSANTLAEARTLYRELALQTGQLNPARKVLIIGNQLKQPLDEPVLKLLPTAEQPLWRALYGPEKTTVLPLDTEARLRAMQLRFLDKQVLADLYRKQGNPRAAQALENELSAQARSTVLGRVLPLALLAILGGVVGLGLLFFAGVVAVRREWHLLGRVAETTEPKLAWGVLLDAFVFYLALYRAVGLVSVLIAGALGMERGLIPLQVTVQFGTGALAIAYLVRSVRRAGASLAELGVRREGFWANVAYGVGGYLATLPLIAVLGMLAKALFKNNPDTHPNPAMTLLSGHNTPLELGLLFLTISVGAPLFEEFFFRGVLLAGLRRRFAGWYSVLLSAVVFALVHPPQDWLPIIGLGLSFGTMRQLRQSLVPGIVAHFLQNTATFLLLRAVFSD